MTLKEEIFSFGVVYARNSYTGLSKSKAHMYNLEGTSYFQGGIAMSVLERKELAGRWETLIKERTESGMTK